MNQPPNGLFESSGDTNVTANEFNKLHPVGTWVKYYPIIGHKHDFRSTQTRSIAWELGHGAPVVKVAGVAGGVCLEALDILGTNEDRVAAFMADYRELCKKHGLFYGALCQHDFGGVHEQCNR